MARLHRKVGASGKAGVFLYLAGVLFTYFFIKKQELFTCFTQIFVYFAFMRVSELTPAVSFGPVTRGVHGGLLPIMLPDGYYASAANVSFRGGLPRTRPAFRALLDLGDARDFYFQAAGLYRLNEGDRLIYVASGRLFCIRLFEEPLQVVPLFPRPYRMEKRNGVYVQAFDPVSFGKVEPTPASGLPWSPLVHFTKVGPYFVVQDGFHQPLILGEESPEDARVSAKPNIAPVLDNPNYEPAAFLHPEIPPACASAYVAGRLIVSPRFLWKLLTAEYDDPPESGRAYLMASDLDADEASAFRFIDACTASGAAWKMPSETGFVVALSSLRAADRNAGESMVVFCQDGIHLFNLSFESLGWGAHKLTNAQTLFTGFGTLSPRSVVHINDDLWFRRPDGIGSLRYAVSQNRGQAGLLSCTPQSFEVIHRLSNDTIADLPFVSAAYCDNRLLMTTQGAGSWGFHGLVSLETASLYSLAEEPYPQYEDYWAARDLVIRQIISARWRGKERFFVFGVVNNRLKLFVLDDQAHADLLGEQQQPIWSRVYTKAFLFDRPIHYKRISRAEVFLREVVGPTRFRLYWRTDGRPFWVPTDSVLVEAPLSSVVAPMRRIVLRPPASLPCHSGVPLDTGLSFEFCLEWEGYAAIERVVVYAEVVPYLEPGDCQPVVSVSDSVPVGVVRLVDVPYPGFLS